APQPAYSGRDSGSTRLAGVLGHPAFLPRAAGGVCLPVETRRSRLGPQQDAGTIRRLGRPAAGDLPAGRRADRRGSGVMTLSTWVRIPILTNWLRRQDWNPNLQE